MRCGVRRRVVRVRVRVRVTVRKLSFEEDLIESRAFRVGVRVRVRVRVRVGYNR